MSEQPKDDKHWEQYRKPKENKTGIKSLFTSNIFWAGAGFIIIVGKLFELAKVIKVANPEFFWVELLDSVFMLILGAFLFWNGTKLNSVSSNKILFRILVGVFMLYIVGIIYLSFAP